MIKTDPLGPFLGMDNRRPDYALSQYERGRKAGDFLRNAVNVDLTAAGTLRRRAGSERVITLADVHSLWADGDTGYCVAGDTLYSISESMTTTAVRTGMTPGLRASFVRVLDDVYWTNGAELGRIRAGASSAPGMATPNPGPDVTASAGGALPAGLYQVAITATNADGEESGATWPAQVDVPEGGKIQVSGLPGSLVNLYLSAPNGEVLFLAVQTTATSYTIPVVGTLGPQLTTLGLRQMPAGQIVSHYNARLLVAAGSVLHYSEPYAFALHNPLRGYIPFPARITVVAPCESGVYVVADKTYWLAGGDVDKAEIIDVLPYGAIEGTAARHDNSTDVWWFSVRGVVVGNRQGQARNIQEDAVSVESAQAGATFYQEADGQRRLVTSLLGADASFGAASSFMEAEIIRQEHMQ